VTAAALALALAACTSSPPDDRSSDGPATGTATIALPVGAPPSSLDPAQLDLSASSYVWTALYDTLLQVDSSATVQPNAAESFTYSDDARTLTLTLRDDLTFSDGAAVTADDVVATIQRSKDTPGLAQGDTAHIESIEATDDRTVVLHLSAPDPQLLINLSSRLGVIGDPRTLDDPRTATDPVGSGPYVLDEAGTVDGTTYVLTRRDDHWNADAYPFEQATVRVIEDTTATFNALQSGEVDAAWVDQSQAARVEAQGYNTVETEAIGVGTLALMDRDGTVLPALADKRVRQAINMAFDREQYVEKLLMGAGRATEQIFNPIAGAYAEDLEGTYPYDPDGAKELLAAAGYPDGFAVTMPSTYLSTTYEPSITQSLADIGIEVTWEPIPPANVATALFSRTYPMAFYQDGVNLPARELYNNFNPSGWLNPFGFEDPALTALMDEVAAIPDPADADALYQQINEYIVDEALTVPLVFSGNTMATSPDISYTQLLTENSLRQFAPAE
jgi:peptide/nickel transport system substrate-binding protein